MILVTNIPSMNTQRNLNVVSGKQIKSSERLSSGLRINRAADDAAGLAISEKMRGQIRGLNQADRNIQDGVSLLNVADGALQEAQNIVHRMRELAVQACNDTNSASDRKKLDEEYKQLCAELEDIAQNTEFNTKKIFTGDYAEKILTEVVVKWLNVVETDPPNNATSSAPTITKSNAPSAASSVSTLTRYGSIYTFPSETLTPKAHLKNPSAPRPQRDSPGTVNYLSGDKWYDGTTTTTVTTNNIGAKIVADNQMDELNVTDNTSYKNNIDGSWNKWQGQKQIRVWDNNLTGYYDTSGTWQTGTGKYIWGSWDEYGDFREDRWVDDPTMVETVGTIEDHSEYGENGGTAAQPKDWENTTTTKYKWDRVIDDYQPTIRESTGDTPYDYEKDEWERAEIYSEAKITKVTNNNGGAVYVRNSAADAETHVVNNSANMDYNLGSVSPPDYPQARVDTNTKTVTVENNSDDATVISRNQEAGSVFTCTLNKRAVVADRGTVYGKIYSGAETTTVTTNNGELYVDSNASNASNVNVTTNSGTLFADSYKAEIGSNSGTIAQLNSNAGSTFNLTGTNSGYVRTDAETVKVASNSGNLVTTNTTSPSKLEVSTNTGTIDTGVTTVTITNNRGYLRLGNSTTTATISSTTTGSVIDTYAQQLTINGTANGSIRVENGAAVSINGTNNAKISILSGGTVNLTGALGGTTTVESGATLNITGDITGTLYVKAGANVSFTGELKGTIVFLGEPASFSPNPLDVAASGAVELQNTTNINIGVNDGKVKIFGSTTSIANNNGELQVDATSNVTVNTNSGKILNLGKINADDGSGASATNTGTIDNWNQINMPFNNAGGTIDHHLPFAEDKNTYDVSGVKMPTSTNGQLDPAVQESVIKFSYNGTEYILTAQWQPTNKNNDISLECTCSVGAHDKTGCTDHDAGLVADVFELVFDIDNVVPPLQQGEQFVFLSNSVLNAAGMRYDIVGRTVVYNVDHEAALREEWEDGTGLWLHTGANTNQGYNVYLPDLTKSMSDITINCAICDCGSLKAANLLNYKNATAALSLCDTTDRNISKVRGYIGAQINRLTYAGDSAATYSENLSSAESRIRDTNIAKEIMINTKSNILSQVGISLLSQSNKNPQMVLELLR